MYVSQKWTSVTYMYSINANAKCWCLDKSKFNAYWHMSMPHFPRCMQPSYTNHHVISNLRISNPYAGIEPAEREARTNTVGKTWRGERFARTWSARVSAGTTVNALAFLKATYMRAKYDVCHAPASESHATNASSAYSESLSEQFRQERKHAGPSNALRTTYSDTPSSTDMLTRTLLQKGTWTNANYTHH